jgi:hypothetical protein
LNALVNPYPKWKEKVLLETVKMLLEALRDIRMIEEALIVLVQAVKMFVEAV